MSQTEDLIAPTPMHPDERFALCAAARLAMRPGMYSKAVAEEISDKLFVAADFGYRLGAGARAQRLAAEVFARRDELEQEGAR